MGGVASFTYYEPAVPESGSVTVTMHNGTLQFSHYESFGLSDQRHRMSFTREGVVSMTMENASYALNVQTTGGVSGSGMALVMLVYVPIPLPYGRTGSSVPLDVRMTYRCKHEHGCLVTPASGAATDAETARSLSTRCTLETYGRQNEREGVWRVERDVSVPLSCNIDVAAGYPEVIKLSLTDAIAAPEGSPLPPVILRKASATHGYHAWGGD
jgi:hypothetical protein